MYFAARTSTTWHSIEFEAWWFDVRVHRCVGLDYCDVARIKIFSIKTEVVVFKWI